MLPAQAITLKLENKIEALQQKLDAIASRLVFLESQLKHLSPSYGSNSENPLEKYLIDKSEIQSIPSLSIKQAYQQKKNHNRHYSQQIGHSSASIKKFESQDKVFDAKSFGMVKQSILLNSHQINHLKQKMIELQKDFIEKTMGMEEGVAILTRVIQALQSKITYNNQQQQGKQSIDNGKRQKNTQSRQQARINRVIKKYQKNNLSNDNNIKINQKIYL